MHDPSRQHPFRHVRSSLRHPPEFPDGAVNRGAPRLFIGMAFYVCAMGREAQTTTDWREPSARSAAAALRHAEAGWGYRSGTSSGVEPSALAGLALLAAGPAAEAAPSRAAADWLQTIQQPDGALGVSESLPTPGWATAYALLLWQQLDSYHARRRAASAWLLVRRA